MHSVEYMAGYGIGFVLDVALNEKHENPDRIKYYLKLGYGKVWKQYHRNQAFRRGFEAGLKSFNLPPLCADISKWIENYIKENRLSYVDCF